MDVLYAKDMSIETQIRMYEDRLLRGGEGVPVENIQRILQSLRREAQRMYWYKTRA